MAEFTVGVGGAKVYHVTIPFPEKGLDLYRCPENHGGKCPISQPGCEDYLEGRPDDLTNVGKEFCIALMIQKLWGDELFGKAE